jgi:hypothetical protein
VSRSRALVRLAAAAAAILALAGCGQVNTALSKQSAVVNFRPDTSVVMRLRVRQACSHVPDLRPLPVMKGTDTRYLVHYSASQASARDLNQLRLCLQRFPDVSGVAILDDADSGV